MLSNITRHLYQVLQRATQDKERSLAPGLQVAPREKQAVQVPYEFNPKDYLSFLIYIDAEIEHGLMIQYLYAAYSLGGPQVPGDAESQKKVRRWQEVILGIAKEEMGHFISVQNVLRLIGAPLYFGRQDYPWDTPFYPFPFMLEPLTLKSLAKYVYAESPEDWGKYKDFQQEITDMVKKQTEDPHRVGALFSTILDLISDSDQIPDEIFQAQTYPFQAKFDEWGRGYEQGARGNTMKGNPANSPDVLVEPLTSRDDAKSALEAIAEQGEAPDAADNNDLPSHFERFMSVYVEMKEACGVDFNNWRPTRDIAINPYIPSKDADPSFSESEGQKSDEQRDRITNEQAQLWGHLFNLRYRMLLTYLSHSFLLDDGLNSSGTRTPRGTIINATFGEMYNLRSIANVLVQTPIGDTGSKMAGPPFMLPYTFDLPTGERNRWNLHKDLLQASSRIVADLLPITPQHNHKYLNALQEADDQLMKIVNELTKSPAFKV